MNINFNHDFLHSGTPPLGQVLTALRASPISTAQIADRFAPDNIQEVVKII